jgi:predicted membrane-bound mannosyltransferase
VVLFTAGAGHLAIQSYRSNTEYYADPRNPYVYAHPSTAFMRLVERLNDVAAVSPDGHGMFIAVVQPDRDYWPLPWYLRRFTRVGYWDILPDGGDPDFVISSPELHDELLNRFSASHIYEMQGLRPSVLRIVYIRRKLWDAFIAART